MTSNPIDLEIPPLTPDEAVRMKSIVVASLPPTVRGRVFGRFLLVYSVAAPSVQAAVDLRPAGAMAAGVSDHDFAVVAKDFADEAVVSLTLAALRDGVTADAVFPYLRAAPDGADPLPGYPDRATVPGFELVAAVRTETGARVLESTEEFGHLGDVDRMWGSALANLRSLRPPLRQVFQSGSRRAPTTLHVLRFADPFGAARLADLDDLLHRHLPEAGTRPVVSVPDPRTMVVLPTDPSPGPQGYCRLAVLTRRLYLAASTPLSSLLWFAEPWFADDAAGPAERGLTPCRPVPVGDARGRSGFAPTPTLERLLGIDPMRASGTPQRARRAGSAA
ncbi:hypothetical protein [Tsukamurella soli]|uniref:SchA/CurD like domain-containing protein n=1 Tax=Tsukamurella soli TaxID=644556 RepID=A0ABP8J0S2_9ACTN